MEQETRWIERIAAGDRGAFEDLFHAYKGRLLGYVYRITGDAPMAEEVVSDALVEVWKNASRFQGRSAVSTWIFGIARHKAIDEIRKRESRGRHDEPSPKLVAEGRDPEVQAIEGDRNATLRRAMQSLSLDHREVLELTFFQGHSVEEIAAITRSPASTVKTRMFYARKKLRELLDLSR